MAVRTAGNRWTKIEQSARLLKKSEPGRRMAKARSAHHSAIIECKSIDPEPLCTESKQKAREASHSPIGVSVLVGSSLPSASARRTTAQLFSCLSPLLPLPPTLMTSKMHQFSTGTYHHTAVSAWTLAIQSHISAMNPFDTETRT